MSCKRNARHRQTSSLSFQRPYDWAPGAGTSLAPWTCFFFHSCVFSCDPSHTPDRWQTKKDRHWCAVYLSNVSLVPGFNLLFPGVMSVTSYSPVQISVMYWVLSHALSHMLSLPWALALQTWDHWYPQTPTRWQSWPPMPTNAVGEAVTGGIFCLKTWKLPLQTCVRICLLLVVLY